MTWFLSYTGKCAEIIDGLILAFHLAGLASLSKTMFCVGVVFLLLRFLLPSGVSGLLGDAEHLWTMDRKR